MTHYEFETTSQTRKNLGEVLSINYKLYFGPLECRILLV